MPSRKSDAKKQNEQRLFEQFATAAKLDAQIKELRESPDLIVELGQTEIGVELTEFFLDPESGAASDQAHESIGDRIVSTAQEIYQDRKSKAAHVTVLFGPRKNLNNVNRAAVADRLATLIQRADLRDGETAEFRSEDLGELPDEISFVRALGVPDSSFAHWTVARAGWVAELDANDVQKCVDKKAKKLELYREAADEVWLLIYADAMNPSSMLRVPHDFDATSIDTDFDRTYFYARTGKVIRLGRRADR